MMRMTLSTIDTPRVSDNMITVFEHPDFAKDVVLLCVHRADENTDMNQATVALSRDDLDRLCRAVEASESHTRDTWYDSSMSQSDEVGTDT